MMLQLWIFFKANFDKVNKIKSQYSERISMTYSANAAQVCSLM